MPCRHFAEDLAVPCDPFGVGFEVRFVGFSLVLGYLFLLLCVGCHGILLDEKL
jgi:hypothetical protein